jgi:hypothetical protein
MLLFLRQCAPRLTSPIPSHPTKSPMWGPIGMARAPQEPIHGKNNNYPCNQWLNFGGLLDLKSALYFQQDPQ